MILRIRLQNFRSHKDRTVVFEEDATIIAGPNASGKTNILEALYVAAQGSSFRGRDADLIAHGSDWARIDLLGDDFSRSVLLERKADKIQKRFIIDDTELHRLGSQRILPLVLFEPSHMLLIHGSPELRRAFLDDLLSQTVLGYSSWIQHYRRALAQRNALLKQGYAKAKGQLFAWDVRISDIGSRIALERLRCTQLLNEQLQGLYGKIAGTKTDIKVDYNSTFTAETYATKMLETLEKNYVKDCERGFTSVGPHREDLLVSLHGSPANEVASRGETRTIILALKIASLHHIEQVTVQKPILLLDDVYAELDANRQEKLTKSIKSYQKIITTTESSTKNTKATTLRAD